MKTLLAFILLASATAGAGEWSLCWENGQTNGPAYVMLLETNIVGQYRIDYSKNLSPLALQSSWEPNTVLPPPWSETKIATGTATNGYGRQDAGYYISAMQRDGELTNVIRRLAGSGEICAVLGHQWREGRPGEGEISPNSASWYADYHPGVFYRTCRICGKCQSQSLGDWK